MATAKIPAEIVAEDKFTPVLKKIQGEIEKTNTKLESFGGLLGGIVGGLGGAFSVERIVHAFFEIAEGIDQVSRRAQELGFTVQELQEIQFAASIAGVRVADFDVAVSRLNVRLDAAAAGAKDAARTFQDMGIKVHDSNGNVITTGTALEEIAEKFKSYKDGAEKSAIAVELFGRAGRQLIPFLNQGKDGIRELREEAQRLGLVLGDEAVGAAVQFHHELATLQNMLTSIGQALALEVIPTINRFVKELQLGLSTFGSFKEAFIQGGWNVDPFKTLDENIANSQAEIKKLQKAIENMPVRRGGTQGLDIAKDKEEIERIRKRITYLEKLKTLQQPPFESDFPAASGKETPKRSSRAGAEKAVQLDDAGFQAFEKEIDKLNEIIAGYKELSLVEQQSIKIREGAYKGISPLQEADLIRLASEAQRIEDIALAEKTRAEERKKADAQRKTDLEEIRKLTGEADSEHIERLSKMIEAELELGNITATQAQRATQALLGIKKGAEDSTDVVQQLGVTFLSSLGPVLSGESQKNFFTALLDDMKKVIVQLLILDPMIRDLKKLFQGDSGKPVQSIFGLLGLLGGGQDLTGVFAAGGYLPSGKYGIAGEQGPELIYGGNAGMTVWPSGSKGGGVTINQSISIDSRSDRASITQAMIASKELAKAEILQSMNSNGAFSRGG